MGTAATVMEKAKGTASTDLERNSERRSLKSSVSLVHQRDLANFVDGGRVQVHLYPRSASQR